ncbi:MAG TPA: S9 family peptidase [Terriglobales bacterium]|nr:S9 family peptidase [Terriglobales bacterium]
MTSFAHAQKKTITHESMWMMKRVGTPVVSPDGKWVVFSVTEPAYDEKDQMSDMWVTAADGTSAPRRLTFSKSGESGPSWSPDSRKLTFSAKREGDEQAQIYVIDVASGGEAQRMTNVSTGARSPQWSPDGKKILFVASVFPGAADDDANKKIAEERKKRKYNARVYERFPIRYWDRWLDDKQITLFVQDAEPGAKARNLLHGTKLIASAGFGGRFGDTSEEMDAVWSPDGNAIIFSATTERHAAAYANVPYQLYSLPVNGGEPIQITTGTGQYTSPAFRPDGKALYAQFEPSNEKEYNLTRVAMMPWPATGQPTVATSTFDRSIDRFIFSADSKTMYLLAEDSGMVKIYSTPANGGEVKEALPMERGVYSAIAIPNKSSSPVMIGKWESSVNPGEVVRIDLSGKKHQALTNFAVASADQIDWQPPRHFWFTSKGGRKIHNMLILPPNFDANKKYPLFTLIHGGAHNMWRDSITLRWNYHMYTSPGYVLLLTNYTGSTGFGEKFAQAIQFDPLKTPGEEINEAVDEAAKQFAFVDGNRLAAGGASYGGHLANWLQATTTRYKCLISHAGLVNLESQWAASDTIYHREVTAGGPPWENAAVWREQSPIRFGNKFKTPMLLSVGENDFRVPMSQTLENWSILQRMRVPSKLIVFPDENHWIQKGENSRFYYGQTLGWLATYLGAEAKQPATD